MRSFRQGSPAPQAGPRTDSGRGRFGDPPNLREKSYARFPRYPQATRHRLGLGESLFHEISWVWPKGADRKRPNLFPVTAGAENRCCWSFGIADREEAKAGRLTKPPLCGSCGLVLERKLGWQASLSAQDLRSLRAERSRRQTGGLGPRTARQAGRKSFPPPVDPELRLLVGRAGPGLRAWELRKAEPRRKPRRGQADPQGLGPRDFRRTRKRPTSVDRLAEDGIGRPQGRPIRRAANRQGPRPWSGSRRGNRPFASAAGGTPEAR